MSMQSGNASGYDCDWICQATSEGGLARIVFRSCVGVNAVLQLARIRLAAARR